MLNPEIKASDERMLAKFTTVGKIKSWLAAMKTSDKTINSMRHDLIKDALPVFSNFWLKPTKNQIDVLMVRYFEARIQTLPKQSIMELHEILMDWKNAKSDEAKTFFHSNLITDLTLFYSINGWFRKKLAGW